MTMMTTKLVADFREKIRARLKKKSAWGCQQVMMEIEGALTDALLEVGGSDEEED